MVLHVIKLHGIASPYAMPFFALVPNNSPDFIYLLWVCVGFGLLLEA